MFPIKSFTGFGPFIIEKVCSPKKRSSLVLIFGGNDVLKKIFVVGS